MDKKNTGCDSALSKEKKKEWKLMDSSVVRCNFPKKNEISLIIHKMYGIIIKKKLWLYFSKILSNFNI